MSIPKTKLRPPIARQSLVARPRLTKIFTDHKPLTVICAPAGSGKTTLALEWLSNQKGRVAWLSLDRDDNDPIRFVNGWMAALQKVGVKIRVPMGQRDLKSLFTELINHLEDEEPIALVLDDYRLIHEENIHQVIAYFLDHNPKSFQLIMLTREMLPFSLAQLKARGQLHEIHTDELFFNREEVNEFLSQIMGLNLTEEQIHSLEKHTQGWAAGLQMAGLSILASKQAQDNEANDHQFISEYLLTEVLNQYPRHLQTFLLNTSIVEKFSPALSRVLAPNAKNSLARVLQADLFISKVGVWYQYHPLFREFLAHRLQAKYPEQIPMLHHKACTWLEKNGFIADAIPHAQAIADDKTAARLIADLAPDTFKRGELVTLRRWLDRLPDSVIWRNPRLCLTRIWLLLDSDLRDEAQEALERLGGFLEKKVRGEFLILRAVHAAMTYRPALALKYMQKAQKTPEARDPFIQTYVCFGLGAAQKMGFHFFQAEQSFRTSSSLAKADGNAYILISSLSNLADVLHLQGRYTESVQVCRELLAMTGENHPETGYCYVLMSRIALQRNQLPNALEYINKAMDLEHGKIMAARALVQRALVCRAMMEKEFAWKDLDGADQVARSFNDTIVLSGVIRQRLLFALEDGEMASAQKWMGALEKLSDGNYPFYWSYARGRMMLAKGKYKQAHAAFVETIDLMRERDFFLQRLETQLWDMVCLQQMRETTRAAKLLDAVVEDSMPENILHPLLQVKDYLPELVGMLETQHERWLAQVLGSVSENGIQAEDPKLTRREQEIMKMIELGKSNQEMAEELVIAGSTLRRHVANLYQKLGAHNRAQAILFMRERF